MTTSKGGRPATGYTKWRRNKKTGRMHWHVRLTLKDGSQDWAPLDPKIPETDKARAQQAGRELAQVARDRGLVPMEVIETVREWFKRFHDYKATKGLATVDEMRGRYMNWVDPEIGDKDVRGVTREHIEAIVRRLDRAIVTWVKAGGQRGDGRLSPSTAVNVWGDLQHAFDEAVRSKTPGLRVLAASPCANVRGPDAGDDREGQILYSDEIVRLLRGVAAEANALDVPLYRRQVYAMAVYTKARSSELEALTAADVDLAHLTITIGKQVDRKSKGRKETKRTKTKRVRTVDIEPNLYPLVEWLVKHPQGKGARLLHMPPPEDRAELLRKDLRTVGVTRAGLFTADESQRPITLHDLRDTGLVHMAVRGDSPIVIQWTGGHTDYKTTQGYVDRGRVEARRIGEPLPPLPLDRLIPTDGGLGQFRIPSQTDEANARESLGNSRPQRESKARPNEPDHSAKQAPLASEPETPKHEPARVSEPMPETSVSLETLRAKLDAAIAAEQWDAVKIIAARIVDAERTAAGNVVSIGSARRTNKA